MKMPPVKFDYHPMTGGLDLLTPAISLFPGKVFDAQNYEPQIAGGYRRINGYERYDGRTATPTSANYWYIAYTPSASIAVGNTVTGVTSAATGKVLSIPDTGILVLGRVTGTFVSGESITVGGSPKGTTTSAAIQNGCSNPSDDADYLLLAADDYRADIGAIPGSGRIRGVKVYNDVLYAFRDNAGGTAGDMYKATTGGWVQVTFPFEISFATLATSSVVTITNASPGVVSYAAHPFVNGQPVVLTTTGTLPTGLTAGTTYYVVSAAAGTFQLAATAGGTSINTSTAGSGVHTCTAVGNTVIAGTTVTGVTSGATATVAAALLRTGTWTVAAAGTLVLTGITGAFQSGEALRVSGLLLVTTSSTAAQITRAPGGSVELITANFTGSTATVKMYGADGVNPAFEFDGTNYIPIHTGMATDTPSHVHFHRNYLFLSFLGSVQISSIGTPYSWTPVTGGSELGTGDVVTGFVTQSGTSAGAALAIYTRGKTFMLYGTTQANMTLVPSIFDLGYAPFTMQPVSNNTYGLTNRGIQALITTLTYGDFDYASISHLVQPLITAKRGMETCSTSSKTKNQYRLFFNDGTALVVGLTGDKPNGILPLNYGIPVRCMTTDTLTTGEEVCYFGSDDGYVYQDNTGTSFDGDAIEAWIRPAFNNLKSPSIRKQFRRAVFEVQTEGYASVNCAYDLGYANPEVSPSAPYPDLGLIGAGGYWDQVTWDNFTWDAQVFATPSISIDGTEKNISFLFYSNRAQDKPHCVTGCSLHYSVRRIERTYS